MAGRMAKVFATAVLGLPAIANAQQQAAFEVASIKPLSGFVNARASFSGSRITLSGYALEGLIMDAYKVESWQIAGGPEWLDNQPFEIIGKAPGDTAPTPEHRRQMLQTLLEERFRLKVHREMKEGPVYALEVAKRGPKIKRSTAGDPAYSLRTQRGVTTLTFQKQDMESLVHQLSSAHLGRPVVDKTGLTGDWDFELSFMPNAPPDSSVPDVFTAVQEQLGLKLEAQKGPVERLVIDHAEKPSAN